MVIGTGASGGIGIGRVMLVREQKPVYERRRIRDTKAELKKLREAVKSFVRSASGAKTEKEAFNALENKRKSGQPDQASAAVAAREFFDPDFMYHSSYNPNFAIVKGKELIKTWV